MKYLIIASALMFSETAYAQDSEGALISYCIGENQCGLMNENGKPLTEPIYNQAETSLDGYTGVMLDGLGGVVDASGKLVVPLKYKRFAGYDAETGVFLALEADTRNWGAVNAKNEIVIPFDYYKSAWLGNGMIRMTVDYKDSIFNLKGERVFADKVDSLERFSDGLAGFEKDGKEGIIDSTGKIIVPAIYESVSLDSQEHVSVRTSEGGSGLINRKGEILITPKYDWIADVRDGITPVRSGDLWGVRSLTDKEIAPMIYQKIGMFSGGYAPFKLNGLWGYMDREGKTVIEPKYAEAWSIRRGTARVVTPQGDVEALDMSLKPLDSTEGTKLQILASGTYILVDSGVAQLIAANGEKLGQPFDKIDTFYKGRATVEKDGKEGTIDEYGQIIVPLIYDSVGNFHDNAFVRVAFKDKVYAIDRQGNPIGFSLKDVED